MTNPLDALTEAVEKMTPGELFLSPDADSEQADIRITTPDEKWASEWFGRLRRGENATGLVTLANMRNYLKAAAALAEADTRLASLTERYHEYDALESFRAARANQEAARAAFRAERDKLREGEK